MSVPGGRRTATTVAGAAALITVVTLASRVVGFGRWLAQAHYVGTGGVDGPLNAANFLPNVLFEVAAGGALAGAVVPLLSGYLVRGDREKASRTASALLGWTLAVLVPLGALVALLADPLVRLTGLNDPVNVAVAADFLRVFAVQVPLYGVAVVLGGMLQAHNRFFWPAFSPLVSSLVVIGVYWRFGALADGNQQDVAELSSQALGWLAWGMTAGVAFLALPLVWPVARTGLRLRPTLRFPAGEGRRAARLAFAGVGALVAQQLALLATMKAGNEAGGDSTWTIFLYAQNVYFLPYAVLAFPIATSAFPRFAELASQGRRDDLARLVSSTTRVLVVVSVAGAAALVAAAPLVENVFDGVADGDADGLAAALAWMAPGLLGYALILQLSRLLYAVDAARAAVVATAAGWVVVAVGVSLAVPMFSGVQDPTTGDTQERVLTWLGGATTVGMTVAGLALLTTVRRKVGRPALARVGPTLLVAVLAGGLGAWLGRVAVPVADRAVPVGPPGADGTPVETPFRLESFVTDVGLGLLAGLVAAAVVLVAAALADGAVRARLAAVGRRVARR
ncbi:MATE family efflux transporter [Isoptericola sp. S6320L]|uniref:murein biosynthesis integral membrane protein MurJ n=1 Tax=Isoptericola sp. S6320L TaxID=2926411 RepID=UPI001FF2D19E|nr:lipid II flippase MurJ [Isoptericola sp. S6320L]MCK0115930.1 MATE family efflux transporter [Isoptericola sp. S6320L]